MAQIRACDLQSGDYFLHPEKKVECQVVFFELRGSSWDFGGGVVVTYRETHIGSDAAVGHLRFELNTLVEFIRRG